MSSLKSSERRMKLILLLQESRKKLTVRDMAEMFGVSRRTIFRDLSALSELNVPVTWEPYSGYGVMPGYKVPPLMFSSRELATIMVGLNFVKAQIDRELVEDARGVELKIRNVLPDELKEFMVSLAGRTVVDPYLAYGPEKKEGGSWYLISSAISKNRTLHFQYKSRRSERVTRRTVDPYLLVFYQDHWNLIGYSHTRSEIRNFLLDRMSGIEMSDQNFSLDTEIDIEALIFRSAGLEEKIVIEVHEDGLKRLESILPAKILKKERANKKYFKVSFLFDNLDYINRWLLQFGEEVKVIAPESLKSKRVELLNNMIVSQ